MRNRPPWSLDPSSPGTPVLLHVWEGHRETGGSVCLGGWRLIGLSVRVRAMVEWIEGREIRDIQPMDKTSAVWGSCWEGSSWVVASSQVSARAGWSAAYLVQLWHIHSPMLQEGSGDATLSGVWTGLRSKLWNSGIHRAGEVLPPLCMEPICQLAAPFFWHLASSWGWS